jgi:rare lipoprotein A
MAKCFLAALTLFSVATVSSVFAAQSNSSSSFVDDIQTGSASYYAHKFEGRRTASGDTFRHDSLTAAHPSLPFGTVVRVTSIERDRSVIVRITDRLPSKRAVIDLTRKAAAQLDMLSAGRTRVSIQVLEWGKGGARALREVAQQTPAVLTAATEMLTSATSATDEPPKH